MVGDLVDTDLVGAMRAGIDFFLETSVVDANAGGLKLTATISNVDELVGLL
jgi:ribonucleotide monophosphatase NagD (HAD superfamily)